MNGCSAKSAIGAGFLASILTVAPALAASSASAPAPAPPELSQALIKARQPAPFPTFASVPPLPKDVRPVKAWKAAVVATKRAGAEAVETADATPWTLNDTEAWAETMRADAAPPPPVTEPDTAAFVAAARARATPPPRAH
ncbi:MAG: hypothetical protein ACREEW_02255 [Caulobacteraceae bacterium]